MRNCSTRRAGVTVCIPNGRIVCKGGSQVSQCNGRKPTSEHTTHYTVRLVAVLLFTSVLTRTTLGYNDDCRWILGIGWRCLSQGGMCTDPKGICQPGGIWGMNPNGPSAGAPPCKCDCVDPITIAAFHQANPQPIDSFPTERMFLPSGTWLVQDPMGNFEITPSGSMTVLFTLAPNGDIHGIITSLNLSIPDLPIGPASVSLWHSVPQPWFSVDGAIAFGSSFLVVDGPGAANPGSTSGYIATFTSSPGGNYTFKGTIVGTLDLGNGNWVWQSEGGQCPFEGSPVPTVSEWGFVVMSLLLLLVGGAAIKFRSAAGWHGRAPAWP